MLPFRADEALVQGQSLSCTLKDGRFFDLFQDVIDEHCSVIGVALMGDDAILKPVVLCEIQEYSVDAGFRGRITVYVTLKAVGRAIMIELTQVQPVMTALCREVADDEIVVPSVAESLVGDIQSIVKTLGSEPVYNEALLCRRVSVQAKFVTGLRPVGPSLLLFRTSLYYHKL
jgi:hypothetical protein